MLSNAFIGVNISGLLDAVKGLDALYPEAAAAGVESANRKVLELLKGPEGYPPYEYVSWASIGGFISERQRRYVMAAIASGEIPPPGQDNRTGRMKQEWHTVGSGKEQVVENDTPDAVYTMSPTTQARMHARQEWPIVTVWLGTHANEIRMAFSDGVQKAVDQLAQEVMEVGL